jgi:hypothetical protein
MNWLTSECADILTDRWKMFGRIVVGDGYIKEDWLYLVDDNHIRGILCSHPSAVLNFVINHSSP